MTTLFISYAREDIEAARRLYRELTRRGFNVWLDQEHLGSGERWRLAIQRQIEACTYFLALLSTNSINKRGYVQKELKIALEILAECPEDGVFLIPLRLDNCNPSHSVLKELNWTDLFPSFEHGLDKLVSSLKKQNPNFPDSVVESATLRQYTKIKTIVTTMAANDESTQGHPPYVPPVTDPMDVSMPLSSLSWSWALREDVKTFSALPDGKYNNPFYEYFEDKIRNAKHDIYITGDGFECITNEGTEIAERFVAAFREALKKGVSVVRVEIKSRGQLKWANMLSELKKEFSDSFQLFLVMEEKFTQMASVCIIDPDVSGESTIEIMLSTHRLFGTKAANIAGMALFIHGQEYLAQDLRTRILALRDSEHTAHPITYSEVLNMLAGEDYYFSFGANMDKTPMTARCPTAEKIGIGVIRNHEIVFNRRGSYRTGGIASIQHSEDHEVYGVIWKISSFEFNALDRTEDPSAYGRYEEKIHTSDGKEYLCHVYKAIPQGNYEPDDEYLNLIINAALAQELPKKYVDYLRSFKIKANK